MLRYLVPFICLAPAALAQPSVFDKPIGADPQNGLQRCTYYTDLTVRETGTDSPGTGPTFIMPPPADTKRLSCPRSGGRRIDLQSQDFVGRKGGFLFFVPTDANGPESFEVLALKDGAKLYEDSMVPDAFKSASISSGGQLHLIYTRAYEGACSLLQNSAGCWAKMMKEGRFGKAISQQAPPVKACQASYADPKAKAPLSDPSMLTYDVDITIEAGKKTVVNSRGTLGCEPGT